MSDDSKELSRVEDILSGEDYLPKKPMSRVEELLMDGAMVPKVDDTDNGKVLKVIDGEWQPGEDVSGDNLPPVSSLDNGKVLKVVSGEWNIGDDKSESSFVYISSSYPFSGSKVALPANINSVLIANYTSNPKVPTFLVTSNNIIFEPKEVDVSSGTTPSVHIRWGRMYSEFDSGTREQNIYNDSLSYNTQNQTTEASYFKTKAIQTIPPVDIPDSGKVMQVGNGGTWQANYLPEVDGVPAVEQADVGKVLKATAEGEYDWEVDAGGSEAVYKTLEEYQALTTAQKEDPTKIYFVINEGTKVSPTLAADDGNVAASSSKSGYYAWKVFSGSSRTDNQDWEYAWQSWGQNNGEWLSYTFSTTQLFSKVSVRIATGKAHTMNYYVEGSNDGTNWTNLIPNGVNYISVSQPAQVDQSNFNYVTTEILLDTTKGRFSKIRFRTDSSIGYPYSYDEFVVANFDIFAAAASNKPALYYKNVLYTPDELPTTSTSDAGKALIVNSDGLWDKSDIPSSCTPVEIEAADYHALTTPQKEDPTKIYFVKAGRVITDPVSIIPRNPSSSSIYYNTGTASYNTSAALAFDGIMNSPPDTRATNASNVTAWYPGYGNAPESAWVSYQFDSVITNLVKLEVYAYNMATSDPSATFTTPIIVEGSTDGTTWFNILADGASSFTFNTKETEFVKNVISLDNTVSVSYIRFRFLNQINGYNEPNFAIAEIYAYTGNVIKYDDSTYYKGIKHGKTIQELPDLLAADEGKVLKAVNGKWDKGSVYRELTQAEYDALPSSKNSDGIIYFIND